MPIQDDLAGTTQALMSRRQQIAAQVEAAAQAHAPGLAQTLHPDMPMYEAGAPTMQAMQSVAPLGYGMTTPKPALTPEQVQQLAALLQQPQGTHP